MKTSVSTSLPAISAHSLQFTGLALALLLAAASPVQAQVNPAIPRSTASEALLAQVKDQYIVVFKNQVQKAASLAHSLSAAQRGTLRFTYEHALKGFSATLSPEAVEALRKNPNVAYVEPDRLVYALTDQVNPPSWGLDRIDQPDRPLDDRYTYHSDGTGVTVFIIDTGIRTSHSDFGGRATVGFDSAGPLGGGVGYGQDCSGHGTHVAGTVGGNQYGVAKNVHLEAVRVLDCHGIGTTSKIIAGVEYVTRMKQSNPNIPMVANMSLGKEFSQALNDAVATSIAAGVVYTVAAGNEGQNACNISPASTPEAITVAATDRYDGAAYWSNWGPCVDLFAPGVDITSAWIGSNTASRTHMGTSMAAPHVAGVAALYLERHPDASPAEVSEAIIHTALKDRVRFVASSIWSPNRLLFTGAPPTADAGEDQTIDCFPGDGGIPVRLDGSGSTDREGGVLTFAWRFGGTQTATGPTPTVLLDLGVHPITLTVTDPTGQSDADTVVVTLADFTPPAITLLGDNPMMLQQGDPYIEPGATATDACDGDLSYRITTDASELDTGTPGTYSVRYSVTDWAGHQDSATRTVQVVPATGAATIGEAGRLTVRQDHADQWHSVPFSRSYTRPVVVMGPASFGGPHPLTLRVRNVTAMSFEFQLDEWDYLDGRHGNETVSYLVLEAGVHTLDDGRTVEAGITTGSSSFRNVPFSGGFTSAPVVVSQITTSNGSAAAVTRQKNVTATRFAVRLQGQESTPTVAGETVAFIAVENGTGTTGAVPYEAAVAASRFNDGFRALGFAAAFTAAPAFVAAMQTTSGGDTATLRYRNLMQSGVELKVEEEQSKDSETKHGLESVGYLAFTVGPILGSGSGALARIATETAATEAAAIEAAALDEAGPSQFVLEANYPNPFNPETEIAFTLPQAATVRLVVFDMLGRAVAHLVDGALAAGRHQVRFEASHLPSGTYLYRIEAGSFVQVRRMVLLK